MVSTPSMLAAAEPLPGHLTPPTPASELTASAAPPALTGRAEVQLILLGLSSHDAAKVPVFLDIAKSRLRHRWQWAPPVLGDEAIVSAHALGHGWRPDGRVAVLRVGELSERDGVHPPQLIRPLQFDPFVNALLALELLRPDADAAPPLQVLLQRADAPGREAAPAAAAGDAGLPSAGETGARGAGMGAPAMGQLLQWPSPEAEPSSRPTERLLLSLPDASPHPSAMQALVTAPVAGSVHALGSSGLGAVSDIVVPAASEPRLTMPSQEDITVAPSFALDARYRLMGWPAPDVLASHRYYPRLASFLSSRRVTLEELMRLSNVGRADCERFLAVLASLSLLDIRAAKSAERQARAGRDRKSDAGGTEFRVLGRRILGRIRRRLERLGST